MKKENTPLIVIIGMTASGKSRLAMELADIFNGEIISADSRTIYKGMDIGTAKPSVLDQENIPHHLIDIVSPDESYTAAHFKHDAYEKIKIISDSNRLPIMAGGTGLYIDGVIYDFAFLPPGSSEDREMLQSLSVEELQSKIKSMGIKMPINNKNPRHLIRTIETNGAIPIKNGLKSNTLLIGIDVSKEIIVKRISDRIDSMIDTGLEKEVKNLSIEFGWDCPGMSAVGYKEWREYFNGGAEHEEVVALLNKNTFQYAKRQRTWFKRNKDIKWVKNSSDAIELVKSFLQS